MEMKTIAAEAVSAEALDERHALIAEGSVDKVAVAPTSPSRVAGWPEELLELANCGHGRLLMKLCGCIELARAIINKREKDWARRPYCFAVALSAPAARSMTTYMV